MPQGATESQGLRSRRLVESLVDGPTTQEEFDYNSSWRHLSGMALNIKDDRADRLARELAAETGESITTAVTIAVTERLERLRGAVPRDRRLQQLTRIAVRSMDRPVLDSRDPDEILGYGPNGLPS
jgi:antitoxin VapB